MRKPITTILALLIVLSMVFASTAESLNLLDQLLAGENRAVDVEAPVYTAFHRLLKKANGDDLPLTSWGPVSTYVSKLIVGDELTPEEMVFDQSLSAYEKFFLINLTDATLSDEETQTLTTFLQDGLNNYPEDGQSPYISPDPEGEGYLIGLMRQGSEMMGKKFILEPIDETNSMYAIRDGEDKTVLAARDALTSLPSAMLMKHVPSDKKQESAGVLARIMSTIPDTINWQTVLNGGDEEAMDADWMNDAGLEEADIEEEPLEEPESPEATQAPELTKEQLKELTGKWLSLFNACKAFDAEGNDENAKLVADALYAISPERPEVHLQPEGGISLNYPAGAATPTPAPTTAATAASSSAKATAKPAAGITIPADYSMPYVIYVSLNSCTIAILSKASNYSKAVRKFPTGIGKAGSTRAGTYKVLGKERWRSWSSNSYSPYCTKTTGINIHGPMYTAKDSNSMVASSYNEIGTKCSAGCLRTTSASAAWIYSNCGVGTLFIMANDSKYKASKPKKIPADQTWDPTDGSVKAAPVQSFSVPSELKVAVGEETQIKLTTEPEVTKSIFDFSSSDRSVATVDNSGFVKGVKIGTCTVTVKTADLPNVTKTVKVTVTAASASPTATVTPSPAPAGPGTSGGTPTPSTPATTTPGPETTTAAPDTTTTAEPTATPTPDPAVQEAQTWLAILYPLDNVAIDGQNSDAFKEEIAKFQ